MRGHIDRRSVLYHTFEVDDLVPADHPLRSIKARADEELGRLRPVFSAAYSRLGRPSIPPEQLLKALLLQALYSLRSERQLCEQITYNFMFRWFVDLPPSAGVWNHSTFTINRERFEAHGLVQKFFDGTVAQGLAEQARASEEFLVDGTLIEAFGSLKSVRPKEDVEEEEVERDDGEQAGADCNDDDDDDGEDDPLATGVGASRVTKKRLRARKENKKRDASKRRKKDRKRNRKKMRSRSSRSVHADTNGWADFAGTTRRNATHVSITDPEARLARRGRGQPARLCHSFHALRDGRSGLVLAVSVAEANGRAEREQALAMLEHVERRHWIKPKRVVADKGYDAGAFVAELEARDITPHVAIRDGPIAARDERGDARRRARRRQQTRQGRAAARRRRAIEQVFGWIKGVAGLARSRFVGQWKSGLAACIAAAAYNLILLSR